MNTSTNERTGDANGLITQQATSKKTSAGNIARFWVVVHIAIQNEVTVVASAKWIELSCLPMGNALNVSKIVMMV